MYKKVSDRHIIIYEAIFKLAFKSIGISFISYELVLAMFFSPRYARASPQELHLISQFLGGFFELNLYKKVSGRRIIRYEAIFKLAFRSKKLYLVVMSEVLKYFSSKLRYSRALPQELHLLPQLLGNYCGTWFVEIETFFYSFMMTKTLILSYVKYKWYHLN